MTTPIKTSHGIALLGACLLVAIVLIAWSSDEIARSPSLSVLVNPHNQLAQVSGAGSSLVGWWKFDDASGNTAADSSGNGNNGTLVNGPTWVAGQIGGALSFNGVDQSVTTPLTMNETSTGISVSFWVKNNDGTTKQQRFFAKGGIVSGTGFFNLEYQFGNRITFSKDGATDLQARSSLIFAAMPIGQWINIAMTWDGSPTASNVLFYKNGVLIPHDSNTDGVSLVSGSALPFTISSGYAVNGAMDDLMVYNRVLSPAEVASIYTNSGGTPGETPGGSTQPPSISSVSASNITQAGATITWTTDQGASSQVQYGLTTGYGSQTSPDQTQVTSHSQTTSGLTANIIYHYTVLSSNINGSASSPGDFTFTTAQQSSDTTAPSVPTNLSATAVSSSQVNLAWTASTDNTAVTGYNIYRCSGNGCTPTTQIGTSATNSYQNTGLTASTAYTYAVSAYDAVPNTSAKSSSASAKTQASVTVNAAPNISNVSVTSISSSGATITWTTDQPSDSQVTYGLPSQINLGIAFGNTTSVNSSLVTMHSVSISGLLAHTVYAYKVISSNPKGSSSSDYGNMFTTLSSGSSFTLSLEKSYEGNGTVTGGTMSCGTSCKRTSQSNITSGTQITLTATPESDSVFLNWGGSCSGSSPTCTVTVNTDMVVNALFQTKAAMAGPTANNITEPGEACDGTDLAGMTPLMIPGYKGGTLKCKADRTGFDVSALIPGNTINVVDSKGQPSCASTDVQTVINKAQDGDTVLVPAGTCIWTSGVSIGAQVGYRPPVYSTKSITLKGAGIGNTIIKYQYANGWAAAVNIQSGKSVRITGFTFDGAGTAAGGAISVLGDVGGIIRIDHSQFINLYTGGLHIYFVYGVVDHDTFVKSPSAGPVTEISLGGNTIVRSGLDSWAQPPSMGTAKAMYLEDNTFDQPNKANGPEDAYEGARFVIRNNQIYGLNMGWHGFDSSLRGIFQYEIYNNRFVNSSPTGEIAPNYPHGSLFESRSGSGVMFNNTMSNGPGATGHDYGTYDDFIMFRNYRSSDGYPGNYGKTWPSPGTLCDGSDTTDKDGNDPGMSGYPCEDQTGRTTNQGLMPTYLWNNNFLGTVNSGVDIVGYATLPVGGVDRTWLHIVQGRDYYNGVAKPGYTSYVYPHPLVQLDGGSGGIISPPLSSPISGSCSTTVNQCTPGTFSYVADTSSNHLWSCIGSNGGTTASCSLPITSSGGGNTTPSGGSTSSGGGSLTQTTPIISSIITTPVGVTSMMISWTTSIPSTSQVLYGLTSVYGSQTAASSSLVTVHSVTISNLQPNTVYHFKILSTASGITAPSSDFSFTTGVSGAPLSAPISPTCSASILPPVALTLTIGSTGTNVTNLQKFLVIAGYTKQQYVTGYFGPITESALNTYLAAHPTCKTSTIQKSTPITQSSITNTQSTSPFTRSLTLGSTGTDVKALQVFLNTHGYTVSISGNGSPGHETTYFGLATKVALIKFQEAHTSTILTPNGLTKGTGYFGPSTMRVVNGMK